MSRCEARCKFSYWPPHSMCHRLGRWTCCSTADRAFATKLPRSVPRTLAATMMRRVRFCRQMETGPSLTFRCASWASGISVPSGAPTWMSSTVA